VVRVRVAGEVLADEPPGVEVVDLEVGEFGAESFP
jgi:hypothetical protein